MNHPLYSHPKQALGEASLLQRNQGIDIKGVYCLEVVLKLPTAYMLCDIHGINAYDFQTLKGKCFVCLFN